MNEPQYILKAIGIVRSKLKSLEECPKQGWEGAPEAWIEIESEFVDALDGLTSGMEVLVFTWLHEARRDELKLRSRGNPENPLKGVFSMRSPHRPNPIGLHRVKILEIREPGQMRVSPLEVIDGTPVIDIKSVADECDEK